MRRLIMACLFASSLLFFPNSGTGEEIIEIDQTAPSLTYDPKSESIEEGKALEIFVQVTDDQKVAKVTLYYRRNGEEEYHSAEMMNTDHDHYAYLIPGEEIRGEKIEYYLVAEDEAGNRTMKGFSGTPLIFKIVSGRTTPPKTTKVVSSSHSALHPILTKPAFSKASLVFNLGENTYRLFDQGFQTTVSALSCGVEGQFPYQQDREIDIGANASHTDSIKVNGVVFQNLSGTVYESLDTLSIYAGQRYRQKYTSFLVALIYLNARLNDRNLLNASGYRMTRFADENFNQAGIIFGFDWHYSITPHVQAGFDPKISLFFSGQLNYITLPGAIRYEF